MKYRKQGFTLIELVVVIVILGILAAFAIPRFISLESQARTAARDALAGSVRSAAALAHALYLAGDQDGEVTMEGVNVPMVNGYPSAAGIGTALSDHSGYNLAVNAATATFANATVSTCSVTYVEAANPGESPVIDVTPAAPAQC